MSTWKEFYHSVKDPSWPSCDNEHDFEHLPESVKKECINVFGYQPGSFKKHSKLPHQVFPIKTDTACQLKWNWSTVFLTIETTASCHRTNQHQFDLDKFDFHNTPEKLSDRKRMLQGQWPIKGCDYCQNIESAGGQSDRLTNLSLQGMHAPPELAHDVNAVEVTPRILEIYFDNTCNLKCLYCGPHFSSLWQAENTLYGPYQKGNLEFASPFSKSSNIEKNKLRLFDWIKQHGHNLTVFNVLGGEPLYQDETNQVLDLFDKHPAPELKLQIFTNLNVNLSRLQTFIHKVKSLVDTDKIREFEITASLDCWGPEQEYVRYPLDLTKWQTNFEYLVEQTWINLIVSSTITPLTIKTLPDLLIKLNQWRKQRPIYHYQNSVNGPSYLCIDIFGDIFAADFCKAIDLKPYGTTDEVSSKQYLQGIAEQSAFKGPNLEEIQKLFDFLNEIDRRRKTSWPSTFPWLIDEFEKYNLRIIK